MSRARAHQSHLFVRATWGVGVSTALTAAAMWRYPGGTALDHATTGYAFAHNFLSDLGMTVAYNGQPNMLGASCFVIALVVMVIASGSALWQLVRWYAESPAARGFARAAAAMGFIACAAFVGVAATPENSAMPMHVSFTLFAFRVIPFAALSLAVATWLAKSLPRRIAAVWLALAVVLFAYVAFLAWSPPERTNDVLMLQVLAQKVVSCVTVAALAFQCWAADRYVAGRFAPRTAIRVPG